MNNRNVSINNVPECYDSEIILKLFIILYKRLIVKECRALRCGMAGLLGADSKTHGDTLSGL